MERMSALGTVLASLVTLSAAGPSAAPPPAALPMTKRAERELRFVAGLLSGHAVVRFRWTSEGLLRRDISSAACPVPEETVEQRLARLRALTDNDRDAWLSYLSKLADADRSGSVSSREGTVFSRRVFLGLTAARLPHVQSAAQLAQLIEEDPKRVSEDLAAYTLIQAAADRDGMKGLPTLSNALAEPGHD